MMSVTQVREVKYIIINIRFLDYTTMSQAYKVWKKV